MSLVLASRSFRIALFLGLVALAASALPDTTQASSLSEVRKLLASDADAGDLFGRRVAVVGDIAVVGAPSETTAGDLAGAAYVFQRDQGGAGNWGEIKKLTASDAQAGDFFGYSVAVSDDIAVIGAPREQTRGNLAGAAYVFQRDQGGAGNWGEIKKLTASDAQAEDGFGWSVALDGDTAIMGAWLEDDGGNDAGAAYVFQRNNGGVNNWGEVKKLMASDAQAHDNFGKNVGISGDTTIVGAGLEDTAATNAGAAYVYQRDEGGADTWGEVKKLVPAGTEAGDLFGGSVAVSGDTAIVGAAFQGSAATGAGAAYVFQRDQGGTGNWGEVKKLTASDAEIDDHFGSAAIDGDTVIIGAAGEDTEGSSAGAAYVFRRNGGGPGNWGQVAKLGTSDAEPEDVFGSSIAISADTAIVGAKGQDAGGSSAGAAYVFDLSLQQTPGDVNCDGSTDAVDATLILQLVAELLVLLPCDVGDLNDDSVTNAIDAALVLQSTAGLLTLPL